MILRAGGHSTATATATTSATVALEWLLPSRGAS